MNVLERTYTSLDKEKTRLLFALIVSLLFHLLLFYLLKSGNAYVIDPGPNPEGTVKEVVIVFPENKPKQIVENVSENREVPEESDLLSERDSRAKNETLLEQRKNHPSNAGNVPFANLSPSRSSAQNSYAQKSGKAVTHKFSRSSLLDGSGFQTPQTREVDGIDSQSRKPALIADGGTDNSFNQKQFSADELGSLTLSTYAWEWASYINEFKRKLYRVWRTPLAYFGLGLIHGHTVIRLTIDRSGKIDSLSLLTKQEVADRILDRVVGLFNP